MHVKSLSRTVMILTILLITVGKGPGVRMAWANKHQRPDAHQHAAPHGGQLVSTGRYHLEIVIKEHQTVQVYIYDDSLQPMAVQAQQATLYLRLPGNKRQTLTLEARVSRTASYFTAIADLQDVHTFEAALRISLDGEPRNLRFTYRGEHIGTPHKPGPGR